MKNIFRSKFLFLVLFLSPFIFSFDSFAESEPVPEGYISVGSFLGIVEDDLYLNSNTNIDALPEGYINPLSWNENDEFGYNMLDNDLSNGEILLVESDLNLTLYSTIPSYDTFDISEFSYYFIDISGQYHIPTLYLDNDFEGGGIPSINYSAVGGVENRSYLYDSDFNVQGISFSFSSLLSGYDDVYILRLNNQETSHYTSYTFGTYNSVEDHYSDLIVPASYGNNNCLWCTNIPNINTISPSLRDGGDDLRVLDENTLTYSSDILGSPNFAITHNYDNNDSYPDGSGGDIENNLFIKDCLWTFSIPKYPSSLNNNGKAIFTGSLNDFQKDHLSDFEIRYTFNIYFTATRDWSDTQGGGAGHDFSDNDSSPSFMTGDSIFSSNSNKTYTFVYQDPNNSSIKYYQQTFEQFLAANETCTFFTKDYLFSNCMGVGKGACTFQQFINRLNNQGAFSDMSNIKIVLECTARLFYNNGGTMNPDNAYTSWYDLYSGSSGNSNDSLSHNDNPFNNDDDNSPDTNTSKNNNGINITITNNNDPTFNNNNNNNSINNLIPDGDNNNGDNLLTWVVKKLFSYIDNLISGAFSSFSDIGNNDETTQNSLVLGDSVNDSPSNSFTSSNSWFSIVSDTYSFIPNSVWNILQVSLIVMLAFIVVGLLVSLVIKIIT